MSSSSSSEVPPEKTKEDLELDQLKKDRIKKANKERKKTIKRKEKEKRKEKKKKKKEYKRYKEKLDTLKRTESKKT